MTKPLSLDHVDWSRLGSVLQAKRKQQRLTQQDVADSLGVARTTVVAIEKGQRRLDPAEIVSLAGLFGLELNDLLRDRPAPSELAVQFKAAFRNPLIRTDEADELQNAADMLQQFAENYKELEAMTGTLLPRQYPAEYVVKGLAADVAADEIADRERARLGLGEGPIADVREMLENDVGIRVFYLELPSWVSGLFGHTEDLGGCIAINLKHPPERRRLSLTHEYCHFLTARDRPDVHVTRSYQRVPEAERLAEAFARRFLMPEAGLKKHIRSYLRSSGKSSIVTADLVHLAQYYRVSFEAYLRRLEELGFIATGTFERLQAENFRVRQAQQTLNIDPIREANADTLPYRYRLLAVTAFLSGQLTERRLALFLHTDRLGAREAVAELSGQAAIDEEGRHNWSAWTIGDEVSVRL